jgi:ATP-binding cassette, subfamily C, bacterial CydD
MRIVDPRLVRHARATRTFLGLSVLIGVAKAVLVIAQAALLAGIITRATLYDGGLGAVGHLLFFLVLVFLARAALSWASEVVAHRTSAAVKSSLRMLLLEHVVKLGSRWLTGNRGGELATLATRGIDALDGYFARYLPQLALAALVPLAICVELLATDWATALIVILTVPLIPVLMVVVGSLAGKRVERQWETLQSMAHHFLDMLSGLGTLAAFGRSRSQIEAIRQMSETQRKAGQAALRMGFLSAFVLELVATLSIAVVAIVIGFRVLGGTLDLETALLVMILAPEAYRPVRQMATDYHESAEGLGAAEQVFSVLDETPPAAGGKAAPDDPRSLPVRLEEVTVLGSERSAPILHRVSLQLTPGRFTGIVAPSGAGKSTVFALLLGLLRPDSGRVLVGGADLATIDPDAWRAKVGWLSQEPVLFAGTVAENIALGKPDAPLADIQNVAYGAAVDVPLDTTIGERGHGLSSGQRRRVALARALLVNPAVLLLDEPTESVDPETEAAVFDALRHGLTGRTVVVVTHRPALLQLCHHVVRLESEPVHEHEEVPV